MPRFLTPLVVEYLDGRDWRLVEEFEFASEVLERIVRVPRGFITDFASIPRFLWPLLPPTGTYGKAAVVHDMLYRHPACVAPACTWEEANLTLYEGMVALGVGWLTRHAIFWGVQLGGWATWDRYRQRGR
ncbi:MAG: DUF1353 domain-containing protein [Bryobacteraceae bacterium]